MAFRGRDPVRTKIVIDNKIIEKVNSFNYLGNMISYEKELDIDNKLHNYLKITGILNNVFRPQKLLTPCRRATQKCVITVPCVVVDGSRISAFFYATSCTCVSHLVWLTYRLKVIASLMQDAWVSSYKQTDRY